MTILEQILIGGGIGLAIGAVFLLGGVVTMWALTKELEKQETLDMEGALEQAEHDIDCRDEFDRPQKVTIYKEDKKGEIIL